MPDGQQETQETLSVSGNTVTVKLGSEQTDQGYSVFELSVPIRRTQQHPLMILLLEKLIEAPVFSGAVLLP